jgi:hypothetical protein
MSKRSWPRIISTANFSGPTRSAGLEDFVTRLGGGQSFEAFEEEFLRLFGRARCSNVLKPRMKSLD